MRGSVPRVTKLVFPGVCDTWIEVGLNVIGRFGVTGANCIIVLYLPELYPTNLRYY